MKFFVNSDEVCASNMEDQMIDFFKKKNNILFYDELLYCRTGCMYLYYFNYGKNTMYADNYICKFSWNGKTLRLMTSDAKNFLTKMSEEKFDKCEKEIENYFKNKKLENKDFYYYIDGMGLANGKTTVTIWKDKNKSIDLEINEPLDRESTEEECLKWIHGIIEEIDERIREKEEQN